MGLSRSYTWRAQITAEKGGSGPIERTFPVATNERDDGEARKAATNFADALGYHNVEVEDVELIGEG